MMDREEQVAQIAKGMVKTYYKNYMESYGEPLREYIKLLMDAAPEDRRLIQEAFTKAYSEASDNGSREAIAEYLGVPVDTIQDMFTWMQPPGV